MSQNSNNNPFTKPILFAILILIIIGVYFYRSQKHVEVKHKIAIGTGNCKFELTSLQIANAQQLMALVIKDITESNICQANYLRGCRRPQNISSNCRNIYALILRYLKYRSVSFCKSNNNNIFAAVDPSAPDVIFLSNVFFAGGDDSERRRTLAHELSHLAGIIRPHSPEKDCSYFEHFSLQTEHCLTCEATIVASDEYSSCMNTKNGSFVISPK